MTLKYILDSHTFLWWHTGDRNLSATAGEILKVAPQEVALSTASVWEMQIKVQLGKLSILPSLEQVVELRLQNTQLQLLSIDINHIFALKRLPIFVNHRDPFDRLLIAQAVHERLAILSTDPKINQYPVTVIW